NNANKRPHFLGSNWTANLVSFYLVKYPDRADSTHYRNDIPPSVSASWREFYFVAFLEVSSRNKLFQLSRVHVVNLVRVLGNYFQHYTPRNSYPFNQSPFIGFITKCEESL